MKQNKNYLSTILILGATAFSFYVIAQNFLSQTNQGGVKAALPLVIPALVLIIPLAAVLVIMVLREVKYGKLLAGGVKSVGFIKKVEQIGTNVKKRPEVKLELEVLEENGNKFQGEVITTIHPAEMEFLKEGEPVPVIYKINNKKEISVDRKPDVAKLKEQIEKYKK